LTSSSKAPSRITLIPLIAATYFIVSGGPYGLEELISKGGYTRALWILLLTPLVWSLPTSMMVGELSSALPHDGGYYTWVRRGLGPFWGFQEAWLSLAASVFDMALYPTLFVFYLGKLVPALGQGVPAVAVGIALIGACVAWNLRGSGAVGRGSFLLGVLLLAPFVVFAVLSLAGGASVPATAPAVSQGGLLAGIFVAMWNYMGWDNACTFAGDVHRPQRTYPIAMLATVALICLTYVVPVLAARHAGLDPSTWSTGSWVTAGTSVGGRWLGAFIVIGGMIAPLGTFNALVLSYSRLPVVMAQDGFLPRVFTLRSTRTGAPWVSILCCAAAYACCLGFGFERLVQIDIILYGLSLALEFAALARLRVREPDLPRPFRVPGGVWGASALGVGPMALLAFAIVASLNEPDALQGTLLALVVVQAGPALYWLSGRLGTARTPAVPQPGFRSAKA
jgi:amino acid transporter